MNKLPTNLTTTSASLSRLMIGPRLAACFFSIILVMFVGNSSLVWQFYQVRTAAERLTNVDQELIAVLRFQAGLHLFYSGLSELAQSQDTDRFITESDALQRAFVANADQTEGLFQGLPPGSNLRSEVLSTISSVKSSLPSELASARALANSRDWLALRLRIARQVQPVTYTSSVLVRDVDRDVATERAAAALSITLAQNRMILTFLITGICSLAIAGLLGVGVTRSITEPLGRLEKASRELAEGNLSFRVAARGRDELSQLGIVFNDMAGKLEDLHEDQRNKEKKLRQNEKELQQLIEFVPLHVFVVRPDGTGQYANRMVLEYHGATLEDWTAKGFEMQVMHNDDRKDYLVTLQRGFASNEPFEAQARIRRHDGE